MLAAMATQLRHNGALQLALLILGAMLAVIGISVLRIGLPDTLHTEAGGVELASFLVTVCAGLLAFALCFRHDRGLLSVPILLELFALRELDFHDWWFEPGLLHLEIFAAPVPLWQKLVSSLVMLGILWVLVDIVLRGTGPFLRALRARQGWTLLVVLGCALIGVSIALDGLPYRLGFDADSTVTFLSESLEEVTEFALFACLLLAVSVWPFHPPQA